VFLDPLAAIGYCAFFIAVILLTMRRAAYAVCALIAVQPFALYQIVESLQITLPKVTLVAVLIGLLAYRDAFAPVGERAPWRIATAGMLVLGATLFTLGHATYRDPVLRESLKALEYVVLFCTVVAAYRLDPDRRSVRAAIFCTSIAVALLALGQEIVGSTSAMLLNGHAVPRIAGPLEGPNQLAGYFDVALPLTLAFAIEEPAVLAYIALAVIVLADVLTFSRGGIIGGIAGIATVALIARKNLRAAFTSIGIGLAGGIIVALFWGLAAHTMGLERFWDFRESDYGGGVGTRTELWHAAWTLWLRHPVFGVGAGNFELEIPLTGLHGVRTHANSLYLQSLVEGGIVLFAATLWLVYTSIATFAREQLRSPLILGALAASIALALHQVVDLLTFYPKVGGEWWIAMGLGAAELAVAARIGRAVCA